MFGSAIGTLVLGGLRGRLVSSSGGLGEVLVHVWVGFGHLGVPFLKGFLGEGRSFSILEREAGLTRRCPKSSSVRRPKSSSVGRPKSTSVVPRLRCPKSAQCVPQVSQK